MRKNTCLHSQPNTFDLAHSPLAGINLIDASAGTGKTYTICGLVLRLIIEKNLPIEQILVVTYTEAATEDLRGRIRQKLRQAIHSLNFPPGEDEFLQRYFENIKDHQAAVLRISEALRSFDEAPIFTIHGFCQRMLLENSFESNTLFDTELIADDSHLLQEIIEDFRRRIFSNSSNLFSQYGADRLTPEAMREFLAPFLPHPFLQFVPVEDFKTVCGQLSGVETEYINGYDSVCREWTAARDQIVADLLHSPALKRNTYNKAGVTEAISGMDAMVEAAEPSLQLLKKFSLLMAGRITAGTKIKATPHILPFYKRCEELAQTRDKLIAQYDRCLLGLKKELFDSFRQELTRRKERDNVYSFDDLLRRLHGALAGPMGSVMAQTIVRKYPAALIDEFQDTDPLQFEIFEKIYKQPALLFLIGDPKQAIYSFRGADIHTYIDAAAGLSLTHNTLGVNYRSTPGLVKAVNTIFSRAQNPFVFDAISFQPVSAAPVPEREYLKIDGLRKEPFILWYLARKTAAENTAPPSRNAGPMISKSVARRLIISRTVEEVARLLTLASADRVTINGKKLQPGDIAILVRKNNEARKMQQALTDMQISSVLQVGDDLFASEEAQEMLLLLNAVAAPGNVRRVKRALLTRLIGMQAHEICLFQDIDHEREKNIEDWLGRFWTYHALLNRYGFIQMFWAVMRENLVRQRLLATVNGERSLTNILHLAEIMHQEATDKGLNASALAAYLQGRLADDRTENIEHQLRLESDAERVKIVTIHKAKGLEYPIVFCPFSWDGTLLNPKKGCLFHRQTGNNKTELVFDAGSPELDIHLQSALREEMAENLRLLYVALTRAVHRCYLFWGPINGAETSAPAYLLHQDTVKTKDHIRTDLDQTDFMKTAAARFSGISDREILADLNNLATAAGGTIRIAAVREPASHFRLPREEHTVSLRYREFSGEIDREWKICSFSSLTAHNPSIHSELKDEAPDRDGVPAPQLILAEQSGISENKYDIYSFPQGAKPGTFLHELLEQADFSDDPPLAEHRVYEKLRQYDYDTNWFPVIAEMLQHLRAVQLHNDIPDLKLANIPPANCLHELEFYFPLSPLKPATLNQIFQINASHENTGETARHMERRLGSLAFSPAKGFMRGFMDLVFEFEGKFYLADWKSNYLGSAADDYRQDNLLESVLSGFYFLQYHIYSLALHLYLRERLPHYEYSSHYGGVFYIYLRGVNKNFGAEYGIYYDLPSHSLIELLEANLVAVKTI